ncbi:hypothetical protein GIB67_027948 [Kingdonia uniflora]|uniref:Glycoside hydrolase family 13 N-terminal domain-containing protein n=1 Tax=Kingdonia uniflora TaxID=39325 RepID=A0A7J7LGW0_9MAGN|nr:hypothetical protein GIB67_027948 [Kingdonia uniflora]
MEIANIPSSLISTNCTTSCKSTRRNLQFHCKLQKKCCRFRMGMSDGDKGVIATKSFAVRAIDGGEGGAEGVETAVVEKPKLRKRVEVFAGSPTPFGSTAVDGGVNFAIYSSGAVLATLCLFSVSDLQEKKVTAQINLDPSKNKTGDVWHVFLKGDLGDMLYGYKFDGKFSPEEGCYYDSSRILLDPYAKAAISRGEYGSIGPEDNCWPQMAGMIPSSDEEKACFIISPHCYFWVINIIASIPFRLFFLLVSTSRKHKMISLI